MRSHRALLVALILLYLLVFTLTGVALSLFDAPEPGWCDREATVERLSYPDDLCGPHDPDRSVNLSVAGAGGNSMLRPACRSRCRRWPHQCEYQSDTLPAAQRVLQGTVPAP